MKDEKRTREALMKCAKWLAYCLKIGWLKDEIEALEKIWWEHHDGKGNLKQ